MMAIWGGSCWSARRCSFFCREWLVSGGMMMRVGLGKDEGEALSFAMMLGRGWGWSCFAFLRIHWARG